MLKLVINGEEDWDEEQQMFVYPERITLELEHSLLSLSKWESIWEKPFLGKEDKSTEQTLSYIEQMCLTPDVPPEIFEQLTNAHLEQVNTYIGAKMSATWFAEPKHKPVGAARRDKVITSELIYYWVFSAEIPIAVETWHLSRLFTLLKVFNEENAAANGKKKTNPRDMAAERRAENERRLAEHSTSG